MSETTPDLNPTPETTPTPTPPLEEWLFAKLPSAPTNYQQLVYEFCTEQKVSLEDALVTLIMYGTSLRGAASPGEFFLGQLPGEAERAKLNDYCLTENLIPEAAVLTLLNRALEQPQVLDEARKSPFVAQAQQQLGLSVGLSPSFAQRQMRVCEHCNASFKPRNMGQRFCENTECWAAGAGFVTEAQKTGQAPAGESKDSHRLARLEGMFQQLMTMVQGQQQQQPPPMPLVTGATSTRTQ